VCGLERGPLRATGGLTVTPRVGLGGLERADTIVIPGWRDRNEIPPRRLIEALQRAHRRGARLVSICSGVFVIAATGLLDGKRATTHWRYTEDLARRYPKIQIEPDVLYVDEGSILTSAGSAAGIDLGLHIIRRDFGTLAANQVARRLVMPPHREGGQAQYIERPVGDEGSPWLAKLLEWVERHLADELTTDRLARQVHVSKRTLARRFPETTGMSPAEWVAGLRIARAKELLETTALPVERVAERCGFGSAFALRHHFRKRLETSPTAYRARFTR
jgi:AraC family transcriptional activator FtrA